MDETGRMKDDIVHLARIALSGRPQDVLVFLNRAARKYRDSFPELSEEILGLLKATPTRSSPLRRQHTEAEAVPVDLDSRLQLLKFEHPTTLDVEPIFAPGLNDQLEQLLAERRNSARLAKEGLSPTRTALFVGPPGVGKTLAARWLAMKLQKPLLILDLAAVMSSFLGRTGSNLRLVLDYAKGQDCVLLLDELDAIAKRRDDLSEVGELKRLVTVLLQEFDDWPAGGLLLAATNHPDLLDPAVWRRFEMIVSFPTPDIKRVRAAVHAYLGDKVPNRDAWEHVLATVLSGRSFSDIERTVTTARRAATVTNEPLEKYLGDIVREAIDKLPRSAKVEAARALLNSKLISQRQAYDLTGISRDTLRKLTKGDETKPSKGAIRHA